MPDLKPLIAPHLVCLKSGMQGCVARASRLMYLFAIVMLSACGGGSAEGDRFDDDGQAAYFSANALNANERYSVTGDLNIAPALEQDSDVLRNGALQGVSNNTFDQAQRLNNPSSVGGYISGSSGVYVNGEPFAIDRTDTYTVPLLANQKLSITLQKADALHAGGVSTSVSIYSAADTDSALLSYYRARSGIVEYEAPSDGEYLVTISSATFNASPVIYTLETSRALSAGLRIGVASYAQLASGVLSYEDESGEIVRLEVGPDDDLGKLQALRAVANMKTEMPARRVEPDYKAQATSLGVNDLYASLQWNLEHINAPKAWSAATGAGVRVAVLDTGISPLHEDLQVNVQLSDGYDFVSSSANGDGDGRDADASEPYDGTYHGTHVAGVIAADTNNNAGIAGVAYDATLIPVRVLDRKGSGVAYDIADGIRYAAGLPSSDGKILSPRADIINLSLSIDGDSFIIADAVRDAVAQGVIIIAAAGNAQTNNAHYPAAYDNVFGVGAVNHAGFRSLFSNFGDNISLMAPGGTSTKSLYFDGVDDDIFGPISTDSYGFVVGTSFAAPHVAGVAALMKQIRPDLDAALFSSYLTRGLLTESRASREFYGYGVIDAAMAVTAVGGALEDGLDVFPANLSFSDDTKRVVLTVSNPGVGRVVVEDLRFDVPWLIVAASDTDVDGLGRYAIEYDDSLMPESGASSVVTAAKAFVSYRVNGGAAQLAELPVFKSSNLSSGRLDNVQVYLLPKKAATSNAESYQVYTAKLFDSVTGGVGFSFDQVPAGDYYLEASTDHDGDHRLFDAGEAVGAYRLSNDADFLRVDANISHADFSVSYQNLDQLNEYAQEDTVYTPRVIGSP